MADQDLTTRRIERNPLVAQLSADGFEDAVEVGRGGFGVVYRCTQIELDRVVAVKVLTIDLDENRPRFEREQRAMAKLTGHPNIVAVLQVGQTPDGHPYLVMPFCRRGCVQTEINRLGTLPLEEVLRLGIGLAAGLESAHRLEIVHRDVKPANVLFTDFGEPALTDFGIAHMAGGFTTAAHMLTGSPAFTAPEVIGGSTPDRASDVYGLGATMFCALTGQPPFKRRDGESMTAYLLRITTDRVPDLREYGGEYGREYDIAEDVAAVVNQALSPAAEERPTMVEFGEALQNLQAARGLAVDAMALEGGKRSGGAANSSAFPTAGRRTRGNLPAPLAGFVGREAELSELGALISTSRLVTLVGVGGVGKTTLAVQAAREQVPRFDDGVFLVEIGELSDGSLLAGMAAGALGIRDQGPTPLVEVMLETLAEREAFVVFDNCEQVVDDAAQLIETLLQGCPRLQILATSREVLGVGGEAVLQVSPLSYPDPGSVPSRGSLARYDAVALFVERARTAQPRFTLTRHNAVAVARICAQLDGLPLAIELAAARLQAMSVEQIAERLSDRFALLTRGRRGAPTRQQTLNWCIGWSYDRCTAQEQQLWARLSVFAGSFDLDTARGVCTEEIDAADLLNELCALVDKSILIRTEDDDVVRFRLLATLREYGKAHIGSAEESRRLQRRHLDWFRRLLSTAKAELFTQNQIRWLNRMRREMANLQEALQFSLTDSPEAALEMTATMRFVWIASGMLNQGRRWVEQALRSAGPEPTVPRINAVITLSLFALLQADWSTANACLAQARDLAEATPDPRVHGLIELMDGFGALLHGELEDPQAYVERALEVSDDFEVQIYSMLLLSWQFLITGDAERALWYAQRALTEAESRGETVMRNYTLATVGVSHFALGDLQVAERAMREGLQRCQLIDDSWTGAQFLEMLAWVAATSGDPPRAEVLLAASAAVCRASGTNSTTMVFGGQFHEECERRVREQLSASEFDAASIEGNAMSFDEAAAFALCDYC